MRIGVIGAGIAAGYLGSELQKMGHELIVFEKSRGFGGRLATRRVDDAQFDHGAPFFTARTPLFKDVLSQHSSSVVEWTPRVITLAPGAKAYKRDWFEPHYVCTPAMGALVKSLLATSEVQFEREVRSVISQENICLVHFKDESVEQCDFVISTAPAEQTATIMDVDLQGVSYSPCFALLGIPTQSLEFEAAVVKDSLIEWIECSSRKPGRVGAKTLVAHASGGWSAQHFDAPRDEVKQAMLSALAALGIEVEESPGLHRWRYSQVDQPYKLPYWLCPRTRRAACGDWGVGRGVESAVTSASKLIEAMAVHL